LLALAVDWEVFVTVLAHQATSQLEELLAFHRNVRVVDLFLSDDVAKHRNSLSSGDVVTCDHSHSNTCTLHVLHGLWNLSANDVHDAEDTYHRETTSFNVFDCSTLVVVLPVLIRLNVLVGHTDSAKGFLRESDDCVVQGSLDNVGELHLVALLVQELAAAFHDNF
jgi:hypothetical protein